ncbi:MAG: UvrB/UvrC motif-containing protein, partial [Firmicutes bacterium]|nr:UvrB/UvrC motif-containing protein [Bacillota bacterium]
MLCQECKKINATVHLTQIVNGEQQVLHLCEQCAREKGEFSFDHPPFSLQSLLTGLMNMDAHSAGKVMEFTTNKVHCENCGLTYAQFGQIGRFGCSECYAVFSDRLQPLMRRIHGSTQHVGNEPQRAGGAVKLRRSIEELRQQLQIAVSQEEFEQAAIIRDQIRQL